MKVYELRLTKRKDNSFEFISTDVIEGDSLVELLAQFIMILNRLHQAEIDEIMKECGMPADDDIPF